ncbi:hypothetical protein BU24DRAFT_457677 [Aaosphaeria arxii CBS 175.79]|uniref:Mediator of RNA polymerase II transcription subunit 12 n=1 Tax=Aaosphaeria arxii CBS 175.79 TaxID=1450172 RepID=A0A6A5YAW0_9PLEO|nr:uncharacterized protein BU24DRAFT_457677 [Aaosphaeria arxii CBS 175.79]KAF2021724.1 hypothetical protein BU24DRAFT_457677 [Aaosphaeria arxii CBS 175.79]
MTSRPSQGIPESLQHRGSGAPPWPQARRQPTKPVNTQSASNQEAAESSLDDQRRPADESATRSQPVVGNAKAKAPTLEGIHTASHNPRPLPKGRPQIFFSNVPNPSPDVAANSPYALPITNLPVPPRPGRPADNATQRRIIPGGSGVKDEAATKAPVNDVPASAVVFPEGKTVDLFPWTGNNPEDILNDGLVKSGISNKPQIMNETNTARPSLWTNLKSKSGIPTLSQLFVAVLEKRQACGRLTTPNTFKPPPRLTLRDSTRESWLHDLANPAIQLRRLSRTIPHGITGKVLLEQCLNKRVPVSRAAWLIKCVGINEMRSHKRKGQAGTMTWVRGWTSSVEQFLDGTIAAIGQADWKPRIKYAMELTTQLYKDHLLENEHYIDWILKNLETCPPERLFLWLLLATTYWPDLTGPRRRGKRLAVSLLAYAEKLYQLEEDGPTAPVLRLLEKIITRLLATSPSSLMVPKTWSRHATILRKLAQRHPHPQMNRVIEQLDFRTSRLSSSPQLSSSTTHNSNRQMVALLDAVDYTSKIPIDQLAGDCMEIITDARCLISLCLQWASSLYRDGLHRVYLATRLIRKWGHLGVDIDETILAFFQSAAPHVGCELHNVFKIIAELVRSKSFSVGKYLQWLIATGALNQNHASSSPMAWPLRLTTEIPLTGLTEQVRNLRNTLLRGTPHATEAEEQSLDDAEEIIRQHLPNLYRQIMVDTPTRELDLSGFSATVRLEIATLLRHRVSANMEICHRIPTKDPHVEEVGSVSYITSHEFLIVRMCLESVGDLAMLADIVGIVSTTLDGVILASAADTLHYNQEAFSAIGAFEPLFLKIAMRYAAIRTIRFPEKELLTSLTDLARAAGADAQLKQMLAYDMNRLEQKNSMAACSPVSDTMTEALHSTGWDTNEEIDRILASGTSMDQQTMARLFGKMVMSLEEQAKKASPPSSNYFVWFQRLRAFDDGTFRRILAEWVKSLVLGRQTRVLHAAIPVLVAAGCLSLAQFLEISRKCLARLKMQDMHATSQACVDVCEMLLPTDTLNPSCPPLDGYKFRLEQRKFIRDPNGRILEFVAEMLEVASLAPGHEIMNVLTSNRLLAVLRHYVLKSSTMLCTTLGIGTKASTVPLASTLKAMLDALVDPSKQLELSTKSMRDQISTIVDTTTFLSLPFSQLAIKQFVSMNVPSADPSADTPSTALLEAVKTAVDRDETIWCDLVSGLDSDLMNKIREHAERELLSASAFLINSAASPPDRAHASDEAFIRKYLKVIDYTVPETKRETEVPIFANLVERFRGIGEALNKGIETKGTETKPVPENGAVASRIPLYGIWLNALLRLAIVHGPIRLTQAPHQHQAALLWSLRLLFTNPLLMTVPSITDQIFDVTALLSDYVTDDVRNHLIKLDTMKSTNDPRCTFVFGTMPHPDAWLAAARPVASIPQANSSMQTQPKQVAQQQQSNPSTPSSGAGVMQRSLSQQQQQQQQQQPQQQQQQPKQQQQPHQQQQQPMQAPSQNQTRTNPQYPQQAQQNKMLSQFQRMASMQGGQHSQLQQMQQMQQMQALAQQRSMQPSPVQLQRQPASAPQPVPSFSRPTSTRFEKKEMKQVPFALKRWEMLPESGGNPAGNETAISMTLFGARRV